MRIGTRQACAPPANHRNPRTQKSNHFCQTVHTHCEPLTAWAVNALTREVRKGVKDAARGVQGASRDLRADPEVADFDKGAPEP